MKSPFKPHGSYQARIEGRILVAHSQVTWNLEIYYEPARMAGPLIKELNLSGPWAYMAVFEETVLHHKEVLDKSGEGVLTKICQPVGRCCLGHGPGSGRLPAAQTRLRQGPAGATDTRLIQRDGY